MKRTKLVLFDIDGTLLWTHGAGRRAIRQALLDQGGPTCPDGGYRFDGKTDPQIVRELLSGAGHPGADDDEQIDSVCRRYVELLSGELERDTVKAQVLDGVSELLDHLEARDDTVIGLLTGNLWDGAQLKLRAAGLAPERFVVGAFGSDSAHRRDLPAIAAERAEPLMGAVPTGSQVVIIGDTPSDVTCGQAIAARAIGVATGSYPTDELMAAGAFAAFEDLTRTDQVVGAIYR